MRNPVVRQTSRNRRSSQDKFPPFPYRICTFLWTPASYSSLATAALTVATQHNEIPFYRIYSSRGTFSGDWQDIKTISPGDSA